MFNNLINKVKVYAFHFWYFQMRGVKATRYRKNAIVNNGYFIDITSGGNCENISKISHDISLVVFNLQTGIYPFLLHHFSKFTNSLNSCFKKLVLSCI